VRDVRSAPDAELLRRHFNSITAENVMKATTIGVSEGVYNYGPADELVAFARANGMQVRGHALVWHQTAPAWFFAGDPAAADYRATVQRRLERYVTDVVTHFRGQVYAWDVVNEPASDGSTTWREDSPWYRALGPDYVDIAFRAARAADPDTKLFINDYNTEFAGKRGRLMSIVDAALSRGVPIDGVGHQLHLQLTTPTAAQVEQALADTAARGLMSHVTELDISIYDDPGSCSASRTGCATGYPSYAEIPASVLQTQATRYGELFRVFRRAQNLTSVSLWGLSDLNSWLETFPVRRVQAPLLFDEQRRPKPAFTAVAQSIA
jgi:endo-1,4-beta-xylanase